MHGNPHRSITSGAHICLEFLFYKLEHLTAPLSLGLRLNDSLQIIKETNYMTLQEAGVTEFEIFLAGMYMFSFFFSLENSFPDDSIF